MSGSLRFEAILVAFEFVCRKEPGRLTNNYQ